MQDISAVISLISEITEIVGAVEVIGRCGAAHA